MVLIFVALVLGFLIGRLIPLPTTIRSLIGKLSSFAILLLLFTMGITIGANQEIIANITNLGLNAFLIASGAVIGSVLAVWLGTNLAKWWHLRKATEVKSYE